MIFIKWFDLYINNIKTRIHENNINDNFVKREYICKTYDNFHVYYSFDWFWWCVNDNIWKKKKEKVIIRKKREKKYKRKGKNENIKEKRKKIYKKKEKKI